MLVAVQLPGVVVKGGHSREQEAAVAAAGAAGDRRALEHDRVDAALGERAGTGQAADPAADHADLGLHPAGKRRARLVGSVEPVGERARAHRTPSSVRSANAAYSPAVIAVRISFINSAMKVRLCSVIRRFAVSSFARVR